MREEALPDTLANCHLSYLDAAGGGDYVSIAAAIAALNNTALHEVLVVSKDHVEPNQDTALVVQNTGGGTLTVIGDDPASNYATTFSSPGGGAQAALRCPDSTGRIIDTLIHFSTAYNGAGLVEAIEFKDGAQCVGCTIGDLSCVDALIMIGFRFEGTDPVGIDLAIRKDGNWSAGAATTIAGFSDATDAGTKYLYNCIDLSGNTAVGFLALNGTINRTNCIGTIFEAGGTFTDTACDDGSALTVGNNGHTLTSDPGAGTDLSGTFTLDINGDTWTTWQPGAEYYSGADDGVISDCISDTITDNITNITA